MELNKVVLSRLLKLEIPEFAEAVIRIVENSEPETLKINEIFLLLEKQKPQIEKLIVRHGAHPLTDQINTQREIRGYIIDSIFIRLKVVMKEIGNKDVNVGTAKIELNRFLQNLKESRTQVAINRRITQFFGEVDSNEEFETTLTTLGFASLMDELRSIHSIIQELEIQRSNSIEKRPKEKTIELERSVFKALNYLFKEVEVAPLRNPDLDYQPLYSKLNHLFKNYNTMINQRLAYNKWKAEQKKQMETEQTDADTETTETIETTEPTQNTESANGMDSPTMEVSMLGSENDDSDSFSDQKNAAVSMSKRKPDISSTEG